MSKSRKISKALGCRYKRGRRYRVPEQENGSWSADDSEWDEHDPWEFERQEKKVQEVDKYYSTLHELPVCPLPVVECVWVSDDVGRVWLSPGKYFEFGEPMQKVRFIVYENAVLARKPHSSSVGFSLPQILADRNFCEGLSHIEARICPIRRNCQHSDTANTVRGRHQCGSVDNEQNPKGHTLPHT